MRDTIGLVVNWFVINLFRKRGKQINWVWHGVWENFFISKHVMSDDIDDIQDPTYQMRRRKF